MVDGFIRHRSSPSKVGVQGRPGALSLKLHSLYSP